MQEKLPKPRSTRSKSSTSSQRQKQTSSKQSSARASNVLPGNLKFSTKRPFFKTGSGVENPQVEAAKSDVENPQVEADPVTAQVADIRTTTGQIQRADTTYDPDTIERIGGNIDAVRQQYASQSNALALLENITNDMNDDQKINQLIENINKRPFKYEGRGSKPFQGHGDCGTLVTEVLAIGREILNQPDNIKRGSKNEAGVPLLVKGGGKIIGDTRTGNVNKGKDWIFSTHSWIIYKGNVIDVLFNRKNQTWIEGQKRQNKYKFGEEGYLETGEQGGNNVYSKET